VQGCPIGVNLSGVPRGSRPLVGFKGCPLETLSFSSPAAGGGRREEKRFFGDTPNPSREDPAPLFEG